jgi:flagellum-specific ATP synthase
MSEVVSERHRKVAAEMRRVMADLEEAEELQTFGAYRPGEVPRFDQAMNLGQPIRTFLRQSSEEGFAYEDSRQSLLEIGQRILEARIGGEA